MIAATNHQSHANWSCPGVSPLPAEAAIKRKKGIEWWQQREGKKTLCAAGGTVSQSTTAQTLWRCLKTWKRICIWSNNSISSVHSQGKWSQHIEERITYPAHCITHYSWYGWLDRDMDERTQKMWGRYTMKYHSILKQEGSLSFVATQMNLEKMERNKPDTENQMEKNSHEQREQW